jgi:HlyD family secretion protein
MTLRRPRAYHMMKSQTSTSAVNQTIHAMSDGAPPAIAGSPSMAPATPVGAQRTRKRRKSRRGLIVLGALVLLVAIGVATVLSSGGDEAVSVETQQVATRTIIQTVTATGIIEPQTLLKISSEVSGEIVFLGVKEGDVVSHGQVLVRVNPESMMAQVDEAEAGILAARSREAQANASLIRAQADFGRLEQLAEKKLATAQEMDAARTQVRIAQAERDAARYGIQQAQAGLRRVRDAVSKTTIVAPISGVVTKLNSKLGEKVVGAIQMTGTEIMTIADLSVIEAVVEVSETDVIQVKLGDRAEIEVDAIPDQKYVAIVSSIANSPKTAGNQLTADQVTNFEVRLRFVSPDPRFRPGMTNTATIETATKANVLSVPIQSVTSREKKDSVRVEMETQADESGAATNTRLEETKQERAQPIVFVKQGDSVVARPVRTGIRNDQFIEILEGLRASDVVVSGSYRAISKDLEDGSKVKVTQKEKGSGRKDRNAGGRP